MAKISFIYKKFYNKYVILSIEDFDEIRRIKNINPEINLLPFKNFKKFIDEFTSEFWIEIGVNIILGLILIIIDSKEYLIAIVPFIFWLLLGGLLSIYNFTENFVLYNKFYKLLNKEFPNFNSYNDYLKFEKLESYKY